MTRKHDDAHPHQARASAGTNHNALPPKEHNVFKSVVRFYETKQLKKALKAADSILKKFPDHGETLAMKGLTVNALDRKIEANELVRRGLRMDMKSHICWHVYGLLYRSQRDYREAAKAYLNALRIDKDNQQILRDLALLQVQIRDFDGLEDTRRRLLTVRPSQRNNWIGFALSYHLLGNYTTALSVLDTYLDTLTQSADPEDRYEASEIHLYKNMILEESRHYQSALTHLDAVTSKVADTFALNEARARLHAALGHHNLAADILRRLIAINPDNHFYHHALHTCLLRLQHPSPSQPAPDSHPETPNGHSSSHHAPSKPLSPPSQRAPSWHAPSLRPTHVLPDETAHLSTLLSVSDQIAREHPYSKTSRRIALDIIPRANHPHFLPRVDAYVRPFLRSGVPSLFSNLKPLYAHPDKALAIGSLFEKYRVALESSPSRSLPLPLQIPSVEPDVNGSDATKTDTCEHTPPPAPEDHADFVEAPCTLLWVLCFLAQHYDRIGNLEKALETIEKAIGHTPTAIELYLVKARILKHCGDVKSAVEVADEARNMDLADRYLNTKCCKYALNADRVSDAESWIALFTRDGDSGGLQALYDLQCMWFELGSAESHLRRGQIGQAMKKFTAVERHFADMIEDQFDFHSYCLRKVTLRAYVTLLRFEDKIRGSVMFFRAMSGLMECLLRLEGMSEKERAVFAGEHADIEGFAEMSEAERRKAVSKRKKQQLRQRQSAGGKGSSSRPSSGADGGRSVSGGSEGRKGGGGGSSSEKTKANPGWMDHDVHGLERVQELVKEERDGKKALLREAGLVVRELVAHSGERVRTQEWAFEVGLRKRKYLQMLRAARRAFQIDGMDPNSVLLAVRWAHEVGKDGVVEGMSEVAQKVVKIEGDVLGGRSVAEFVEWCVGRSEGCGRRRVGLGRVKVWAAMNGVGGCGDVREACAWTMDAIEHCEVGGVKGTGLNARFCAELVKDLGRDGVKTEVVADIVKALRHKLPRATCF